MKSKGVIVSGYFNPIHIGHIEYFSKAKEFGDMLIVIINNDFQRQLKGSKEFMLENERLKIVSHIDLVDKVILSIDKTTSVIETLKKVHKEYSQEFDLIFANGGDQLNNSIPERNICQILNIKLLDNLGEKIQSSSWLINKNNNEN